MSITSLRSAILLAGAQPAYYTHVELLRQLITVWGGTSTQNTINGLLKEAIATAGGTATQNTTLGLLKELVAALGGDSSGFRIDDLWALIAVLPFGSGFILMEDGTKVLMEDGTKVSTETGGPTAPPPDLTPDNFTPGNRFSVPLSSVVQAPNTIVVSGLSAGSTVSAVLTGDASSQGRLNGGAWGAGPWTVGNGDQLDVRHTSSGTGNSIITSTMTIGGVAANFSSTTIPIVQLATTSVSHNEGNTGATNYAFTVTRTGDLSLVATVNYAVTGSGGSPANAADFVGGALPTGIINFGVGEGSVVVSIDVQGDTTVEGDETFTLTLSSPVNAVFGAQTTATGTIVGDDVYAAPVISFLTASVSHPEGNTGQTDYVYTVQRTGDPTVVCTVDWAVTGSGLNPAAASDFIGAALPSGTLTFNNGDTSKTLTVSVAGDTTDENDESFTVTLSNVTGTGATLGGASTASGSIVDDDGTSVITLQSLPGVNPLILSYTSTTAPAGTLIYWEFTNTQTPSYNADGTFTTRTQWGIKYITGEEFANLCAALGYATPAGPYSVHVQELVDNDSGLTTRDDQYGGSGTYDARPFSNTVSNSITASVARLSTAVNNCSPYIGVSADGYTATHKNASVGALCAVRADQKPAQAKWWWAPKVVDIRTNGKVYFGVCDQSLDLDTPGYQLNVPGTSSVKGWCIGITAGANTCTLYRNGNNGSQGAAFTGGVGIVDGDQFYVEEDDTAGTFSVSFIPAATGTPQLLFSNQAIETTAGTYKPTNPTTFVAGSRGDGTTTNNASDTMYSNFGQNAPPTTPTSGFLLYA